MVGIYISERSTTAGKVAKMGRRQLKEIGERREKMGIITPGQEVAMKRREATAGNLQGISAADQLALLAELAEEDSRDEDDEDEEEGGDEEEMPLEA